MSPANVILKGELHNMVNLNTLDNVIAVVVVLLVLSLIVQSIQALIKKVWKIKSDTLLNSMVDLFRYVDVSATGKTAEQMVKEVTEEMKKIGRKSYFGNLMVDSIAQGDVEKILKKLGYDNLVPSVNTWFGTVMQSFEERYTRHMKTLAVVLAFAVVIFLNANFFEIYRKISTDAALRTRIIQKTGEIDQRLKDRPAEATPGAQADEQLKADIEELKKEQKDYIADYKEFGFAPITSAQWSDYYHGSGYWAEPGVSRFWYGLEAVTGWTIMALLLSVGAPFWQDALESLFGIKNLLRQRSDTRNVEKDKGGNPNT